MATDKGAGNGLKLEVNTKLELRGGFVRFITGILEDAGVSGVVLMHVDRSVHGTVRRRNTLQIRGFDVGMSTRVMFRAQVHDLSSCYEGRLFFSSLTPLEAATKLATLPNVSTMGNMDDVGILEIAAVRGASLRMAGKKVTDEVVDQTVGLLIMGRFAEGKLIDRSFVRDAIWEVLAEEMDAHGADRRMKQFAKAYLSGNKDGYRPTAALVTRLRSLDSDSGDFEAHTLRLVQRRLGQIEATLEGVKLGELEAAEARSSAAVESAQELLKLSVQQFNADKLAADQARVELAQSNADLAMLRGIEEALSK